MFCLLLTAGLGLGFVPQVREALALDRLRSLGQGSFATAMAAYLVASVVLPFLWVPRSVLITLGGVLFGGRVGFVAAWGTSVVEAVLLFLVARHLARAYVARLLASRGVRTDAITVTDLAWMVFVARLCPIAHAGVTSYMAGMSRLSAGAFALATAVGYVPNTVAWALLGDAFVAPVRWERALLAGGYLAVSAAVTLYVLGRFFRKVRVGSS